MMSRIIPELSEWLGSNQYVEPNELADRIGLHRTTMRKVIAKGFLAYAQVSPRKKIIPTTQFTTEKIEQLASFAHGIKKFRESQVVYFIRAGADGPIKIGIACDLDRRLFELQQQHYLPLSIVATINGGMSLERELHRRFAEHRIRGEWFLPHPDIFAEIERLAHG